MSRKSMFTHFYKYCLLIMENSLPLSHPHTVTVDVNTHAAPDHNMAIIEPKAASSTGDTVFMPMPPGLIPVGNAVSATGNA